MTSTEASAAPLAPPADYPHPNWAPAGDEYHVPGALRAAYAAANPTAAEEADYWRSGCAIQETFPHEAAIARAEAAGRDLRDFRTIEQFLSVTPGDRINQRGPANDSTGDLQRYTVTTVYELSGREGFPMWLHLDRLQQARRQVDQAAQIALHATQGTTA